MLKKGEYVLKAVRAARFEKDIQKLAENRDASKRIKGGTYDEEKIKSNIDAFIDSLEPDTGDE